MTTIQQAVQDLRNLRRTTGYTFPYCLQLISQRTGWDYGVLAGECNKGRNRKKKPSRAEYAGEWWQK